MDCGTSLVKYILFIFNTIVSRSPSTKYDCRNARKNSSNNGCTTFCSSLLIGHRPHSPGIVNPKVTVVAHSNVDSRQQMHIPECNLKAQLAIINAVQMKTLRKLEQINKQNRLYVERFKKNDREKLERIQKEKDQEDIKIGQKETLALLQEILMKLTPIKKLNDASLGNTKEELDTFQRDTPKRMKIKSRFIPNGFQLIGSRYLNIVTDTRNWADAGVTCRQMGGYLAAIQNQEEYDVIKPKLMKNYWYWLGINYRQEEGQYVSVASGNPAPFFMWNELHYEPNSFEGKGECISIINDEMYDSACEDQKYFICQLDNLV
uniref:CD209 antigen-like n=1 Tax=Drosophila rhopaloa TaxID=1041015 RepID=A0A6P4ESJ5_DRORH